MGNPSADKIMPPATMRPLLLKAKEEEVPAAIGLTIEGEGVILLGKNMPPKQVLATLKTEAGKQGVKLNATSLRFGRAEFDATYDSEMVRFFVNKDPPTTMWTKVLPVIKANSSFKKVEINVDASLEQGPADDQQPSTALDAHSLALELRALNDRLNAVPDPAVRLELHKGIEAAAKDVKAGDLTAAADKIAPLGDTIRKAVRAAPISTDALYAELKSLISRFEEVADPTIKSALVKRAMVAGGLLKAAGVQADPAEDPAARSQRMNDAAKAVADVRALLGPALDRVGVDVGRVTDQGSLMSGAQTPIEINQRLKGRLDEIAGWDAGRKAREATAMTGAMTQRDPADLAQEPGWRTVERMAVLTSVATPAKVSDTHQRWETPPAQMEALTKIYAVTKLDPDFEAHDKLIRDNVLAGIAEHQAAKLMAAKNWTPAGDTTALNKLRALQNVQKRELPADLFPDPNDSIGLDPTCSDLGAFNGTKVLVSTLGDNNKSFSETLNTVVHETTHAYQSYLAKANLPAEDPRYVQAQMFKFNYRAYLNAPVDPGGGASRAQKDEFERLHKAYKNQPTERHAWQAGDEAGRLFDARAAALGVADTVSAIGRFLPGSLADAKKLSASLSGPSLQSATAAVDNFNKIAEGAVKAASDYISAKMRTPGFGDFVGQADFPKLANAQEKLTKVTNGSPPSRLKAISALANIVDRKFAEFQGASSEKALHREAWGILEKGMTGELGDAVEWIQKQAPTDRIAQLNLARRNALVTNFLKQRGLDINA